MHKIESVLELTEDERFFIKHLINNAITNLNQLKHLYFENTEISKELEKQYLILLNLFKKI
jgi:hypothetical protein